jgi:predicted MFS family arabinose efflux permease
MTVYFVGGTLGTMFGTAAVEWFGWAANSMFITALIAIAAVITLIAREPPLRSAITPGGVQEPG